MKTKFNMKIMAASVCLGMMAVGTTAKADSLLAPLVISDSFFGFETLFSVKVRGQGIPDAGFAPGFNNNVSALHYTYLRKGNNINSLFDKTTACNHENGNGRISSWDMINHTIDPANNFLAQPGGTDASVSFNPAVPFYGMAVLDDVASLDTNEGDSSGFAYVMNYFTGMMLDYKLLNNHRSSKSGDFSVGFTRKTSVDLSWNPLLRDATIWLGVATGESMTTGNSWAGSIRISQATNTALGNVSPTIPHNAPSNPAGTGVYNNDEVNFSGDIPVDIVCMAMFGRDDFMNSTQEQNTRFGGWTRKSIIAQPDNLSILPGAPVSAGGGMVYKAELKWIPSLISGTTQIAFQPETSGHLSSRGAHPNRPY